MIKKVLIDYKKNSFMYTSHEKIEDYEYFFDTFINACQEICSFEFKPRFLAIDAWKATATAIANRLPTTVLLMCYFHVKYNIRKRLKNKVKVSDALYNEIMNDVTALHECQSQAKFQELLETTLAKWSAVPSLNANVELEPDTDDPATDGKSFVDYFTSQWIESQFHRWQLSSIKK